MESWLPGRPHDDARLGPLDVSTVQSLGHCAGPLGAKEIEHLYIGSDQDTALLTVVEHRRVEEVAIQGA